MKNAKTYNITIYCGLQKGYSGKYHKISEARKICQDFTNEVKQCVTLTKTEYIYVKGKEQGIIVGFINYPRFPHKFPTLKNYAITLAKKLLIGLTQNRVSIVFDKTTVMIEKESA
jgi:hypothetical protein